MPKRVSQPTIKDVHDMPPVLDENGICRFCGTFPEAIRHDPDQLAEFPTGHLHRCRAILRGWTTGKPGDKDTTQAEILEPLKKRKAARDKVSPPVDNDAAAVARGE